MSAANADEAISATAVNDVAIVVLIVMSSPARAVSGQNAVVVATAKPQVIRLTPNRTEPLPGIFNFINEYREHKESAFAALMCFCGNATNESHPLLPGYNSFGSYLTMRNQ
jgi:hypothetical protein